MTVHKEGKVSSHNVPKKSKPRTGRRKGVSTGTKKGSK